MTVVGAREKSLRWVHVAKHRRSAVASPAMRKRPFQTGMSISPALLLSARGSGSSTTANSRRPALRRPVRPDLDIADPQAMHVDVPRATR